MIQVVPQQRVFLAVEPVDFRRGIDGLCAICRDVLYRNPFSGYLFLFTNRRRTGLKILAYDGSGFWLCQRRLSQGTLAWWPRGESKQQERHLATHEVQALLMNQDPSRWSHQPFRKVLQP
jgi:transposase